MTNPRIVRGRRGSGLAYAVRGTVLGETFLIGVPAAAAKHYARLRVETHLIEEAKSLHRLAEREGAFDWVSHGYVLHPEFHVWEKALNDADLARLMS